MAQSIIYSDTFIAGSLSARAFTAPSGSITDDSIQGNAGIQASKLQQQHAIRYSQKAGTAVVSETTVIHLARAAGDVIAVEALCVTPPTSSDTITIDLQDSTGGGAYATILTAPLVLNSSTVARTIVSASVATAAYADNDSLELIITASGTSCQGLAIVVTVTEAAN